MESQLLEQGVELMLVGMGTVFVFLATLVLAMGLMTRFANLIEPPVDDAGPSSEEVAAISAAIALHRKKKP